MYGQGSYASQFRQGPPPPYQQASPVPPPPPVYQHGPPPAQVNTGHSFMPPPPPIHGSAPVVPVPSYTHPSYPPPAHHALQPMLQPPRMLHSPPPPPSQGKVLYRTPPPPPPGIQHVWTPPPPSLSSFIPITPAPFASFTPAGGAQLPPLPSSPPPLPPSPPPIPPPPPLSTSPAADLPDVVAEEPSASPGDNMDTSVTIAHSSDDKLVDAGTFLGEIGDLEEKGCLVEGQESGHLPLSPPKPVEEEVVRRIESLCKFIADVGPEFENFARAKESGNPQFAFLFGGEPGSAAAIGHEYFQWMKRNYQLITKSPKDSQQNVPLLRSPDKEGTTQSADLEDVDAGASPAVSDMDMEGSRIQHIRTALLSVFIKKISSSIYLGIDDHTGKVRSECKLC